MWRGVRMGGQMHAPRIVRVARSVGDSVTRGVRMTVAADAVHLVPARIVAVMRPAMAAAEAKECHGGHAGRSENHTENVEIHLILDVARVASPAQSKGELRP